jgi:toxin ParE1/3/4
VKVRYRPTALQQIDDIFEYISVDDSRAARRVVQAIKSAIVRIGKFPFSARPSVVPGIRELTISRYRYIVFYAVDEVAQEVLILRVRHTSQNPEHHLD